MAKSNLPKREVRLPKSLRKYIRLEKARIRREVSDLKGQEQYIQELYQKIFEQYKLKSRKQAQVIPSRETPAQPVIITEAK